MTDKELKEILEKHIKWLNCDPGGKRADLQGAYLKGAILRGADLKRADLKRADLQGADLRGADLRGAYLRGANLQGAYLKEADLRRAYLQGANLRGACLQEAELRWANLQEADLQDADLDYSCLPLFCGSLSAHFDDRQIIQILYHAVKAGVQSRNVSEELKTVLYGLADTANKFHRVGECGRIEMGKKEDGDA